MPCPLNCTKSCQQCYEKVIAGVTEYRCYGQCVVVDQMGISHNGPGEAAPAGWTLSPEVTEEMAAYTAMYNNQQTPSPVTTLAQTTTEEQKLALATTAVVAAGGCEACGVSRKCPGVMKCYIRSKRDSFGRGECKCFNSTLQAAQIAEGGWKLKKPVWWPFGKDKTPIIQISDSTTDAEYAALIQAQDIASWKLWQDAGAPPTNFVDRLTQTAVEEQKAALTVARSNFNSKQTPTSQLDCCSGGPCDVGNCWSNNLNPCKCQQNQPTSDPGKPVWKRYVRPAILDRLTQTTTEEQKAALTTARKAANFDRNSTTPTMGGSCASCLGNQCSEGYLCWHRQIGTDRDSIIWECKCFPQSTNPNKPTPGGWIPKFFDKPSASASVIKPPPTPMY